MEQARGAGDLHGFGPHRSGLRVWPVLSRRTCISSGSLAHPDANVLAAVRGRTFDHFLRRTRGPFLSIRHRKIYGGRARRANRCDFDRGLWVVYDTARLGLGWFRVGLCVAMFLVNDRVKLLAYQIFDPISAKAESNLAAKREVKTLSDLTPYIVERGHALYERLGREEIQAVEDMEKVERETRK